MKKIFFCSVALSLTIGAFAQSDWKAPKEADALKNPFKGNAQALAEGKKIYTQMCVVCHGESGKGDGVAGKNLKPKPGNYTTAAFQSQTDGAIFWKLTHGKGAMAAYEKILEEKKRWQVVCYIRSLGAKK
jgi:mono/diheme cytochrome c family protein